MRNIKTNYPLELDGYNEELNLAFEYDGEYHYKKHHKGSEKTFQDQKKRDKLKTKICKEKGVILIRIPYTEKNNLESFIKNKLQKYSQFKDFLNKE